MTIVVVAAFGWFFQLVTMMVFLAGAVSSGSVVACSLTTMEIMGLQKCCFSSLLNVHAGILRRMKLSIYYGWEGALLIGYFLDAGIASISAWMCPRLCMESMFAATLGW
ncbi:hypothetical protein D5086_017405 [Populus alba]|uniref:Uncharacterized protein n=1 Tax=Populus alba TaxID=43335 RepID=A0ACC4BWN4_POPAL